MSMSSWIPIKTRPLTEEEAKQYFESTGQSVDDTCTLLDCPLPEDGQEVLISWGNNVSLDIFRCGTYGCCYFKYRDIDDVSAWMPLPKPYQKGESE